MVPADEKHLEIQLDDGPLVYPAASASRQRFYRGGSGPSMPLGHMGNRQFQGLAPSPGQMLALSWSCLIYFVRIIPLRLL